MDRLYPQLILDTLKHVKYPGNGKDIVSLGMVEDDIRIDGNKVSFSLIFEKPNDPFRKSLIKAAETTLQTYIGDELEIKGNIAVKVKPQEVKPKNPALPGVKNIIAVASGKGGVGKSTISSNLAVALAKAGYKTGLLDTDVFGPSLPTMFGLVNDRPIMQNVDGKEKIIPIEKHGLKLLSMGFFVDPNNAVVWRGAMATGAIKQLITDVHWGELDFLVLDLPPGTSDIHLTLVQTLSITGAVIVSTPQEVALADARKGINMFVNDKINVPVLGLVENMAWFTPAELPENKYYIFGKEGCKKLAAEMKVPLLGQIPIVQGIREGGDSGEPVAVADDTITSLAFADLAKKVVAEVQKRNEQLPPTEVVEIVYK